MAEFEVAAGTKENFTAHLSKCFDPIFKRIFQEPFELNVRHKAFLFKSSYEICRSIN
jgi:hypothetical protein